VVFIGIGDVADYVRRRIEEAVADVGPVENIRVVAPELDTRWEESRWSEVVSDLPQDHKISATADMFMEQFAAAYIMARLDEHLGGLSADRVLVSDLEGARQGLFESDALSVLQWARGVDINPRVGEAVLKSPELGKVLVALGRLAGSSARLRPDHVFDTDEGPIEVLVTTQTASPRRLVEAAENRLLEHAYRGEPQPLFVVAGGVGTIPKPAELPRSIIGDKDEMDIVDGPFALTPEIRHADEVIAS